MRCKVPVLGSTTGPSRTPITGTKVRRRSILVRAAADAVETSRDSRPLTPLTIPAGPPTRRADASRRSAGVATSGGVGPAGFQSGDRDPERRARDVVQTDLVEEVHRLRVAAVLAADPEREARTNLATAVGPDPDEFSDAFDVD